MVALALLFLAGILLVQQLTALPEVAWLALGFVVLSIMTWRRQWCWVFLVSGILWAIIFASARLSNRLPEKLAGQDIPIQGYVADLPEHECNHVRFNFNVVDSAKPIPKKLRLTWYYPDQIIKAGQEWAFTVRLRPPHGTYNPGGFDYERWLFVEGIGASGYIRTKPVPKLLNSPSANFNPSFSLLLWRQQIVGQLEQVLGNSPSLSMIKALTIGDGDSLTPQQWDVFRKTGTTHLMVISGSHIGLIAGLVYLLVIRLWAWLGILKWSPPKVAAVIALVTAIFYAGLTGFSVPAQRSALMIAIAMIAIVQQRNTQPYNVLAVALFAVLVVDPLVVLSAGFWLSFIAVSLIIYVIAGRLGKPGFIRGAIKINWVTSVGLAPLLLFFFQQISLIALLANFIAVPVISLLIVPLVLLATLVMLITPSVAAILFLVVDWILQGLWWVLTQLADLPLATITHAQPSWWALACAIPGIALLFAPKGTPSRWLGAVILFPLVFTTPKKVESGSFKLTLLDVGQGLSAVVQTANHVLVYDTGARFSSTSDMGQSVVGPYLRSQDIDKVDTLIVSHGDNDHIGGVASLASSIQTGHILTSVPEQLSAYSPSRCQLGQSWVWDQVRFTIISPQSGQHLSDNDGSCVLQIQARHGSALLTGDIEAEAEALLTKTYHDNLKAEVLVAPHHGSQTSSTATFLKAVRPSIILIPAGYRNQFGHPHEEVIQRYRDLHVNWLNSSDNGAIQVSMDKQLKVKSWRAAAGHYWNFRK